MAEYLKWQHWAQVHRSSKLYPAHLAMSLVYLKVYNCTSKRWCREKAGISSKLWNQFIFVTVFKRICRTFQNICIFMTILIYLNQLQNDRFGALILSYIQKQNIPQYIYFTKSNGSSCVALKYTKLNIYQLISMLSWKNFLHNLWTIKIVDAIFHKLIY